MDTTDKHLPFALLDRYWGVRPRVTEQLLRLKALPTAQASPVDMALGASLLREVRRTTSRDSFGRALRPLPLTPLLSRLELIDRLEEAETALKAFHALYHGGPEEPDDDDEPASWRVSAE